MLSAWLVQNRPGQRALAAIRIGGVVAFVTMLAVALRAGGYRAAMARWPLLDLLVGIATASALVVTALEKRNLLRRFFALRPLVAIGAFSYSLYLMHPPLLQLLWQYGLRNLPISDVTRFGLLCTAGAALILWFSRMFHLAFEAPFMRPSPAPRALLRPDLT
jgi:peptidoglycan/LPS O-acetylase OafA/YrhL